MTARDDRDAFYDQARSFTPIVLADARGARFLVHTGDETVGRSLFVRGTRGERTTLAKAIAVLDALGLGDAIPGSTFVDVGANLGTSTVFALRSHAFGSGLACEPEPANYALLRLNLVLNDVDDRVRPLPVAVSDANGSVELARHTSNSGGHQLVGAAGPSTAGDDAPRGDRITVERVTLDELAARGLVDPARAGLLWIDVQGHEGHVLKGATSLTRLGVPALIEYYPALLRHSGGLALLERIAVRRYTHFVDVRAVVLGAPPSFELLPVAALADYADGFGPAAQRAFTDLLLVRR